MGKYLQKARQTRHKIPLRRERKPIHVEVNGTNMCVSLLETRRSTAKLHGERHIFILVQHETPQPTVAIAQTRQPQPPVGSLSSRHYHSPRDQKRVCSTRYFVQRLLLATLLTAASVAILLLVCTVVAPNTMVWAPPPTPPPDIHTSPAIISLLLSLSSHLHLVPKFDESLASRCHPCLNRTIPLVPRKDGGERSKQEDRTHVDYR